MPGRGRYHRASTRETSWFCGNSAAECRASRGEDHEARGDGSGGAVVRGSPQAVLPLPYPHASLATATPSNCGKPLKTVSTKGAPKGGQIRSVDPLTGRAACAWPGIIALGTVTTTGMCQWDICSQALPLGKGSLGGGRVSTLPPPSRTPRPGHGCSSETRRWWAAPPASYPKRPLPPGGSGRLPEYPPGPPKAESNPLARASGVAIGNSSSNGVL